MARVAMRSAGVPVRHGGQVRWPAAGRAVALLVRGDRAPLRFIRFSAASAVSTVASQLTLTGLYALGGSGPTMAGVLAFCAGAVPNYLLNRWWAWRRRGRPALRAELLPYAAVLLGGGLVAVGLTTAVGLLVEPAIQDRAVRAVLLGGAYQGSFALLFVVKFAVLDRVVFRRDQADSAEPAPADPGDGPPARGNHRRAH
jgi:putative flippase GtrA